MQIRAETEKAKTSHLNSIIKPVSAFLAVSIFGGMFATLLAEIIKATLHIG